MELKKQIHAEEPIVSADYQPMIPESFGDGTGLEWLGF